MNEMEELQIRERLQAAIDSGDELAELDAREALAQIAPKQAQQEQYFAMPSQPKKDYGYGNRIDGTPKGRGYFGELKRPDGGISTELSIGVEFDGNETQIPSLVPTLTRQEIDYLLAGNEPTDQIVQKAVDFAKERMSQGGSPFAGDGDIVPLPGKEDQKQSGGFNPLDYIPGVQLGKGIINTIGGIKSGEKSASDLLQYHPAVIAGEAAAAMGSGLAGQVAGGLAGAGTALAEGGVAGGQQEFTPPSVTGGRGIAGQESKRRRSIFENEIRTQIPEYQGDVGALQEIGAAPELNDLMSPQAFKASLAASLIGSDYELAQAVKAQFPEANVSRDKDLNLIVTMPSGGSYYLNAPGFSGQDVAKLTTRLGSYALGGTGGAGVAGLVSTGARAAAVETALQGAEAATGGEFNPEDVAISAVAAPIGQVIGQNVIGPLAQRATEGAKTVFAGGRAARTNLQAAVDDFAEFGGVPTVGQGTGVPLYQGAENIISKTLAGGPIRNAIGRTVDQVRQRLAQIANDISPVSGEMEAGRSIQRGITGPGGFVSRFSDRSGALWRRFDDLIDNASPVPVPNTAAALDDLVSTSQVGQIMNNPLLARIRGALGETGGSVSYADLRSLRSAIGRRLGGNDLVSDIPRAELRQIYAALSRDLEGLAASSGDDAVRAWTRANRYTAAGHARMDDFVERIANKVDLDKVFNSVSKGGEGVQAINAIKRSLNPDEWEVVVSNVVRRLGRATSGNQDDLGQVFSVNKFLTDWDKLGRAKNAMFSGSDRLNSYRANLDRIASAANRFKESAAEMANPSGTGQALTNTGAVVAGAAALGTGNLPAFGTILGGLAATRSAASLMSSPRFVQWMAQATTANSLPEHLSRLGAVAAASENKEEILDFLETMGAMSQELTGQEVQQTTPEQSQ